MKELAKIINTLEKSHRIPFSLFYKGSTYGEIAEEMNLSESEVRERIFDTRKKIKSIIAAEYSTTLLAEAV